MAVLQLAEQGKIDIEQPVIDYLPEFPYSPEITIRQLVEPFKWPSKSDSFKLDSFGK